MFHVGDQEIEALGRHDLGDRRMSRQRPPAQNRLALVNLVFRSAHTFSLLVFAIPRPRNLDLSP